MISAYEILNESLRSVVQIEGPGDRANAHIETLKTFIGIGEPESAIAILSESVGMVSAVDSPEQRDFLFLSLAKLALEAGRGGRAREIAGRVASREYRDRFSILFAEYHLRQNEIDKAIEYANSITDEETDLFLLYEKIVSALVKNGRKSDALELIDRAGGEEDRTRLLFVAVKGLWEAGKCDDAGELFEAIRRVREIFADEKPLEISLLSLMCKNSEAIGLLGELEEDDRFSCMIEIAVSMWNCGNRNGVIEILEESMRNVHESKSGAGEKADKLVRIGELLYRFGEESKAKKTLQDAIVLASESKGHVAYRKIAGVLAELGERKAALKLYRHCLKDLERTPGNRELHWCVWIVDELLEHGFLNEAIASVKRIEEWLENDTDGDIDREFALETEAVLYARIARTIFNLEDESELSGEEILAKSLETAESLEDPIRKSKSLREIALAVSKF